MTVKTIEFTDIFKQVYYRDCLEPRNYNPGTGRFISEDPIGFSGNDLNLYRYVGNNPINYTDPSGRITIGQILAAVGVLSAVQTTRILRVGRLHRNKLNREIDSLDKSIATLNKSCPLSQSGRDTKARKLRVLAGQRQAAIHERNEFNKDLAKGVFGLIYSNIGNQIQNLIVSIVGAF